MRTQARRSILGRLLRTPSSNGVLCSAMNLSKFLEKKKAPPEPQAPDGATQARLEEARPKERPGRQAKGTVQTLGQRAGRVKSVGRCRDRSAATAPPSRLWPPR